MQPWFLPALDLLALLCGTVGAVLLALAIGKPSGGGDGELFMTDPEGKVRIYPIAYIRSIRQWRWGIGLVLAAFLLQLPRAVAALARALV